MVHERVKAGDTNIEPPLPAVVVGFMLLVTLLISACVPAPEDPVRIATLPWPGYESMHLAQTLGYIDERHLRTVEFVNPGQIAAALRNGTVAAGMITLDSALGLMQEGIQLQVILVMGFSHGADVLLARPAITDLQQLRGKRIGVENSAVGGVMLDAALTEAGLTVMDVELLNITTNEQAQAYREGRVDAVITYDPTLTQLLRENARVLFDSSRTPERIVDLLVVRKEMAEPYKKPLAKIVKAHFRALDYMAQQPEAAHAKIAPFLGISATDVAESFTRLIIPSLEQNYQLLGGKSPRLKLISDELATFMLERQLLLHAVSLEQFLEPAYLPPVEYQPPASASEVQQ